MACSNDLEKIHEISIQNYASFPIETIKQCQIIYSDSAKVRVLLNATLMNRYTDEKKYIEFKDGLRVQFFDINGKTVAFALTGVAGTMGLGDEVAVVEEIQPVLARNPDSGLLSIGLGQVGVVTVDLDSNTPPSQTSLQGTGEVGSVIISGNVVSDTGASTGGETVVIDG